MMESSKSKQNASIFNTITLQNCKTCCSESEIQKFISKFNHSSSLDSEHYQYSSLEVSDNEPKQLSSIPENINEEQSSSMIDKNETGSKIYFMELMKSPQQNKETFVNKISSNDNISPKFCCQNCNSQQKISSIKENEFNKKNINKDNELVIDNNIIRLGSNQCICTSSSCNIF